MSAPNLTGFSFGAATAVYRRGGMVHASGLLGGFTLPAGPEIVSSTGGSASYPVAARAGRGDGKGTVTLHEAPAWIERITSSRAEVSVAAAATPVVALNDIIGTDKGKIAIAAPNLRVLADVYVKVGTAGALDVSITGTHGVTNVYSIEHVSTETAHVLGNSGITLTYKTTAASAGSVIAGTLTPAHGGGYTVTSPGLVVSQEYAITLYTAQGGESDSILKISIPRAVIMQPSMEFTEAAVAGSLSIPYTALANADQNLYTTERLKTLAA